MSKYANMFGSEPPKKTNLFGDAKPVVSSGDSDIEAWRAQTGFKTSLNRLKYLLNGIDIAKMKADQISDIGVYQVNQASEANRKVDIAVTEFSKLKTQLEAPKQLILDAIGMIEGGTNPRGWLTRLVSSESALTLNDIRVGVDLKTKTALVKMQTCVKYHIIPFLIVLRDTSSAVNLIDDQLGDVINTLMYIADKSKDVNIQDLARRRAEMFNKSSILMKLNQSQLLRMEKLCEQNKEFASELEMSICPIIDVIIRQSIVDVNSSSLQDIANKLKGVV